jgi:protein O-mannosyl-transferase
MPELTNTFIAPTHHKLFTKVNLIFIALLVVVTVAAMYPCLSAGFVDWEDPANLLENSQLKESLSWASIGDIFASGVSGSYSPLPVLTFALEKAMFAPQPQQAPFIFHLTNLWMHLLCTILVFALLLRLGTSAVAAFLGALLFGVHPMHVESVAWISQRKDVLYGIFYLSALISYVNYIQTTTKKRTWLIASLAFSLLAYFSTGQAVMLPLSLIAIDFLLGRKWHSPDLLSREKALWWVASMLFGIAGLLILNRGDFLNAAAPLSDYNYSLTGRLAMSAYAYGHYLIRCVYPFHLTLYHPYPAHVPAIAYALLPAIPLSIGGFLYWAVKKKATHLIFGWLFFTVNIVLLLQFIPSGTAFIAERFTYIPYIGLFFVLAKTYDAAREKYPKLTTPITAGLAVYCLLLAGMSYVQAATWENTPTVCKQNSACYPGSYYGHNQAGIYYFRQSFEAGISDDKKLQLLKLAQTNFIQAYQNDSAAGSPSAFITSDIAQNVGIIYGLLGEKSAAIRYFSVALSLTPDNLETIKNRAYQYFINREPALAAADYTRAIQLEPGNPDLYYLRANSSYAGGELVNAMADLNKAILLGSKDPNCYIARSVINRANGDLPAAREDAQKARDLGADVPEMYFE